VTRGGGLQTFEVLAGSFVFTLVMPKTEPRYRRSAADRAAISVRMTGKRKSAETRQRMSDSQKRHAAWIREMIAKAQTIKSEETRDISTPA